MSHLDKREVPLKDAVVALILMILIGWTHPYQTPGRHRGELRL